MAFKKQICFIAAASFALAAFVLAPVAKADVSSIEIPELNASQESPAPFGDSAWDRNFSGTYGIESDAAIDNAFHEDTTMVVVVARETPDSASSSALIPMPSGFGLGAAGLIVAALISRKLKPRAA